MHSLTFVFIIYIDLTYTEILGLGYYFYSFRRKNSLLRIVSFFLIVGSFEYFYRVSDIYVIDSSQIENSFVYL